MDVILSQKDADWIAGIMREKIRVLDENYKDFIKEKESKLDVCNSLAKVLGIDKDEEIIKDFDDAKTKMDSMASEMYDTYQKCYKEYERIIELMMIGSESA